MALAKGAVHARYLIALEGTKLVVRQKTAKQSLTSEFDFGTSTSALRVIVSGDRVVVLGSYPNVRSFVMDASGQLTESRGFALGAANTFVAGDELVVAILPHMPPRANMHDVLLKLPLVQIHENPTLAPWLPLVNGAEVRGNSSDSSLVLVGRCSFVISDPKKACLASATLMPREINYTSAFTVTKDAALLQAGGATYRFPWTGASATVLPLSK